MPHRVRSLSYLRVLAFAGLVSGSPVLGSIAVAEELLHQRIDKLIAASAAGDLAARAEDGRSAPRVANRQRATLRSEGEA